MQKNLYRSRKNRIIGGICAGLGIYFDIDPVLIRFFSIIALFITGIVPLTIAYVIGLMIIPYNENE